ncbi:MAG: Oxygen-independent coproporphyrinogen-III oxidase-like protein YqeR [Paracidovorax wautersii]|uniref:Heme chaperone HemW n=1 Tax=Paracidovorax wautersii TaxID=1177982 RepID=A0A7V8FPD7_9BURK|nr:MAG: Oxygen-independent coproporphyrinogen-III oxidase-like protein YqeR [Paracidovorax wautersii]
MIPIHDASQGEPEPGETTGAPADPRHYMRAGTLRLPSLPPLSLYVHLPWCIRKCPYCDFNSHEVRGAGAAAAQGGLLDAALERQYIAALMADIEAALPIVWGRPVHSVFIGGGTPSLFSPQAIDELLSGIRARLPLEPQCEVTLEANPGTFEKHRFKAFRAAGVTRLSIGVQSFNDEHLRALGRVHDRAQAVAAVEEAASAFDTFNLDLMYALPGQDLASLDRDLDTALALAPPHLSIYHLTIEPNTYFAKFPPRVPEDDTAYAMLDRITERTAQQGLARYEVSAYARAGHRCRHNLNYWQFGDYLGVGAGAHSKLSFAHRVVRQVRWRDPQRYLQQATAGRPIAQEHEVSRQDLPFEFMLNALRLVDGFDLQAYTDRTGLPITSIARALDEAERKGLLVRDWSHAHPTERGLDFLSDLQSLFLPDEPPAPGQSG